MYILNLSDYPTVCLFRQFLIFFTSQEFAFLFPLSSTFNLNAPINRPSSIYLLPVTPINTNPAFTLGCICDSALRHLPCDYFLNCVSSYINSFISLFEIVGHTINLYLMCVVCISMYELLCFSYFPQLVQYTLNATIESDYYRNMSMSRGYTQASC